MQVETVEERPRDPRLVAPDRVREAAASVRAVSEVAARAGVHGRHELEARGKLRLAGGPHDRDPARFERFAQHVEDGPAELRQLVEEQHPVVGERDLARPGRDPASHQPDRRGRVVRRPEGPLPPRGGVPLQAPGGVDGHRLQRFGLAHGRQQAGQAGGEHGLPGPGGADHEDVVAAGGGDFEGPLGHVLPPHVRELGGRRRTRLRDRGGERLDRRGAQQMPPRLREVGDREERHRAREGRFPGVAGGQDQAAGGLAGRDRAGDRAPHRLHPPVQGELPDHLHPGQALGRKLP